MKLGIMQPYFFPYIGYWQLMNAVDKYVLYDNIEYTKKGWINRNRLLCQGSDRLITISIKKDSDFLDIRERRVSDTFNRKGLMQQIETYYHKAPYLQDVYPVLEKGILYENDNLFEYIKATIFSVKNYLDIDTEIIISSTMKYDNSLRGEDKVLAICKELEADEYINAIGGMKLYDFNTFKESGISLSFLKTNPISYQQFGGKFIENLSIIDVLMFNSKSKVKEMLGEYTIVTK